MTHTHTNAAREGGWEGGRERERGQMATPVELIRNDEPPFSSSNRGCFPFRFYFNTHECINTQRQESGSPELPLKCY